MPSGVVEEVQLKNVTPRRESTADDNSEHKESEATMPTEQQQANQPKSHMDNSPEEGVEVILGDECNPKMVESPQRPRPTPDQNVFRHPHPVRPRAMRAPGPPPPPQPYLHGSGSWGYPPPPQQQQQQQHGPPIPPHGPPPPGPYGDYHSRGPPPPYPVPPYNPSGSFDEHGYHTAHHSPHINYPGYRPPEEVNVISPNHKGDPHYRPPPTPTRSRHMPPPNYYHYPPTSPVSRAGMPPGPPPPPNQQRYGGGGSMRHGEGPYSKAQRGDQYGPPLPPPPHHDDFPLNQYPGHTPSGPPPMGRDDRPHPSVVTEASFDSEHHSRDALSHASSHPPTPSGGHHHGPPLAPPPPPQHDPQYQFYGGGAASWGSFDSAAGPPPQFDDQRYYGFPPPESPYSAHHVTSGPPPPQFSPGALYQSESFPPPPGYGPPPLNYSYSYDDEERFLRDYRTDDGQYHQQQHHRHEVSPHGRKGRATPKSSNKSKDNRDNMLLPKAAEEIDFDVTDPPMQPTTPPSEHSICDSLTEVNTYDVLCGRGGGTNSQIGNRRFRKLVQDFQPTYLLARRKEKPLLARTIVLIIRKRGGRFLKKDEETGELFEVGDAKAEAKTSQALREGLDVRATKSAASSLLEKKKKKQQQDKAAAGQQGSSGSEASDSPKSHNSHRSEHNQNSVVDTRHESPPPIPRLQEVKAGVVHPHSPEQETYRKRRRMRTVPTTDRFFPDFCPPRADLSGRHSPQPNEDDMSISLSTTPLRRNSTRDEDDDRYAENARGCAGIALDVMTGAATGSFCLGPSGWSR